MTYRRDSSENSGERLKGVRRTKSGKYGSVINDPIKRKQVWLGSFDSAEEATNAYLSKRLEFQEQLKAIQVVQRQTTLSQDSGRENMTHRRDSTENSGERLKGVRRTKSGKYGSVINDPINKKQVWLGSFDSAEEATNAYLYKRHEFQEQLKAIQAVQRQTPLSQDSGRENMTHRRDSTENSGERLEGFRRTKSGQYGSVINDPIKKKQVWLGSFDSAEEATDAYLSKKCEFQEQLKAKQVVQRQPILSQDSAENSGGVNMTCRKDSAENSRERLTGVRRRNSGKYTSEIQDPIRKKRVYLGTFRAAQEAANAYLSKKCEFQEQLKAKQVVQRQPIPSQESGGVNMTCRKHSAENSRERLTGVRRRNSGKYTSEIQDPIRKKKIYLGTFRTAQEAANAYLSKKCEFQEQLKAKQVVQRQPIPSQESGGVNMTCRKDSAENSRERLTGVRRRNSGKYTSEIQDPIRKKKIYLGTFRTAQEAANAYLSKKCEFQEQLKAKQVVQRQPIPSQESGGVNMTCRKDSAENSRERLTGVRRRNSGKYTSEIQDPIRKKRVYLGTFRTAQEAASAYLSKKCEFQEQLKAKQVVQRQPILSQESGGVNMTCRKESAENSRERLTGVRRRNSGKYTSEIQDPIRKKKVYLGTFRTAQEAANAYLSKKCEFQEKLKVKQVVQRQPILSQESGCTNMTRIRDLGEKSRKIYPGVTRRKSGRYASTIKDLINGKTVWLGTFDTSEEFASVYHSKQVEFKARQGGQHICCKESEIESSHEVPSSMPETKALTSHSSPDHRGSESETCNANAIEIVKVENDERFIMGLFKAVPSCQGVNVGSEFFFPILDKNGFLLGEFSKLDDLSICQNEDDYVPTKF